jgi:hypothetical protein
MEFPLLPFASVELDADLAWDQVLVNLSDGVVGCSGGGGWCMM